jgi:hypothetical protein
MLTVGMVIRNVQNIVPWGLPAAAQQYAIEKHVALKGLKTYQRKLPDVQRGNYYAMGPSDPAQPVRFLLWGDSHAQAVLPALEIVSREYGIRGVAATHSTMVPALGCDTRGLGGLGGDVSEYYATVLAYVRQQAIPHVLLVAKWERYDDGTERLQKGLERTIADVRQAGATPWIMRMVPTHRRDVPKGLAVEAIFGQNAPEQAWPVAPSPRQDAMLDHLRTCGAKILDSRIYLLDAQKDGRVMVGGKMLYMDKDHIAPEGAKLLRPLFLPLFAVAPATATSRPDGVESLRP